MSLELPRRDWVRGMAALAGIAALLWVLVAGRPPQPTLLWKEIFNLGHIPLFGMVALLALVAARAFLPAGPGRPLRHYLLAFVVVALISLVSEIAQINMASRQVEVQDAVHNLLGAICFLVIRSAFDPLLWDSDSRAPRGLLLVAASLALFVASWTLIELAWHYGMRSAAFPRIVDLDSGWQQPFISAQRADIGLVPAPAGWKEKSGHRVSVISFPQNPWPGVTIREVYPDWTRMKAYRMQVFSTQDHSVHLTIRIEDALHNQRHNDRFNRTLSIEPGLNDVSIPLKDIRDAPVGREMDLSQVWQLILFTSRPEEPLELHISDIWLE
ncbi:MAG: hypothetical protein OEU49_01915 [Chromatiales bacterium]|nr:hypothetical protein [Chromatiales bacterium]MDH4029580.1 hypothetical protein [Chromatiales bacterium]